jgi:hypothetical protein
VFVYRTAVGDKLLVLRIVVQSHIWFEQAIHQLFFLFLTAYAGESGQEQNAGGNRFSHTARLPELPGTCKANLLMGRVGALRRRTPQRGVPTCPREAFYCVPSRAAK